MKLVRNVSFVLILISLVIIPSSAWSIPILQLYAEGATYNSATESWEIVVSGDEPLRLWAIGNVAGDGGKGTIYNVKLAVAYEAESITKEIEINPSWTFNYGEFTDNSTPGDPSLIKTVTDGSVPVLADGTSLPSHGEYGPGIWWQEFLLGDFLLFDSPIADFIGYFPEAPESPTGQINVYEINVSSLGHGVTLHFDLYDGVQAGNKLRSVFAPFSHDLTHAPEPGTMILVGTGLLGLATLGRRKLRHKG